MMNIQEIQVFLTIAAERSFSRAATKLHRTQSAVSQALKRLEDELGERLIDRTTKDGRLTEAGRVLQEYGERLMRLDEEAQAAVRDLRDLRRGRVLIGSNEGSVHGLLPLIKAFRDKFPGLHVDVRRVHARDIPTEVAQGSLDMGLVTFHPQDPSLISLVIDVDDLVLVVPPGHDLARRRLVHMDEIGRYAVVAHNEPSPARERVLRNFEQKQVPIDIAVSMPSIDGIKRAVVMGMGIAILPHRLAFTEITRRELIAIRIPELRMRRHLRLVHRQLASHSHAAREFIQVAEEMAGSLG
jgi:DNA-binding transcriptional LysR family regulator